MVLHCLIQIHSPYLNASQRAKLSTLPPVAKCTKVNKQELNFKGRLCVMGIEMRMLERMDYDVHQALMMMAFGRGKVRAALPAEAPTPVHLLSTIGLFEDGKLQASVSVEPFRVHFGHGTEFDYGAIGGVACANDRRGRGYVQQLMSKSLERMRSQNQPISGLYPFSYAFYRKFGWDNVGQQQTVTLPVRELKRNNPTGWSVDLINLEANLDVVKTFYDTFARQYRSSFVAASHKWHDDYKLRDGRCTFVYTSRDPHGAIGGVMRFQYPAEGSDDIANADIWATTPAAWLSLLDVLRDIGVQHKLVRFSVPSDVPVLSFHCSNDIKISVGPMYQGRIVSIDQWASGLSLPQSEAGLSVVLDINDPSAKWNHGTWEITRQSQGLTAIRTTKAHDVAIDITHFSQLAFGEPSVTALLRAGVLPHLAEETLRALHAIFPAHPTYLWDGF